MLQNSVFANLGSAELPRKKNAYINDGRYLCEIQDVKKHVSNKPGRTGQVMIIIELLVMEVLADKGDYTTPSGEPRRSNVAGEVIQTFINLSWYKAMDKVMSFLCAAAEITPEQAREIKGPQWAEFAEKSCYHLGDEIDGADVSEWTEQPLRGKEIVVEASTILTDAKKDFTRVQWEMAPSN